MPEQPLALQWLCFIRDHGVDLKVTLGERALASLLPTYGQGKKIFVSMVTLAKVTGWSRNTVKKHRDGLIAKGLLEDITGDPDKQSRTYRLKTPGYVLEPGQILTTPGQILTTPGQILTTPWSNIDHNIKLEIEIENQSSTSTSPDGDGVVASLSSQSQNQAPAGPRPAGADSDLHQFSPDEKGDLAKCLGVSVESIHPRFWTWYAQCTERIRDRAYAECACQCENRTSGACTHPGDCPCPCPTSGNAEECTCPCEHDARWEDDVQRTFVAARLAADKRSPVGYFQATVESYIETQHAKRAQRDAA